MSFHKKLAHKAYLMGRTSQEFHLAAQQHANATWFTGILTALVWYFANWRWAIIPLVLTIWTAIKSVSSTATAIELMKMEALLKR